MVGDDEWYLGVEFLRVPTPEEVDQAVVVPGDQYRHLLGRIRVAYAPVHPVPAGQRRERRPELITLQSKAFALYLQTHEKHLAPLRANVLVGGEDVAVVHGNERGDCGDKTLLVRTGDK